MLRQLFLFLFLLASPLALQANESADPKEATQEEAEYNSPYGSLDPQDFKATFFKTLALIAMSLGVVIGLLWLVKQFSQRRFKSLNQQRYIKVIEKRPISPKTMLYVIEVANEQIVLSESQLETRILTQIKRSEPSS